MFTSPHNLMTRRQFALTATLGIPALLAASTADEFSTPFDEAMDQFMRERNIPGGALAVVKDKRLVLAKGYGLADRDQKIPVRPDSLFRIASISKPITAVAVMKLVEDGKLSLDAKMLELINVEPLLENGAQFDERHRAITVRHLLQHTGGWDRDKSFDPMFRSVKIAEATGTKAPAEPPAIIRYMLGRKLDFDPGTRYAYSNLGYCILGRIIEKLTGGTYADFIQQAVLSPCGIRKMRLGHTLENQRAADEVRYYTPNNSKGRSVFPDSKDEVPWPYGDFYLEAMDAHGAWLASAVDLARFAAALHDSSHCPFLKQSSIQTMFAQPPPPMPQDGNRYYGCGWSVRKTKPEGALNTWHTGSLTGTSTLLVRRWDGLSWAVLFNQRSNNRKLSDGAIDPAMHGAADKVKSWPEHDLFQQFAG
jgi:N-acyl-D-amino-acid deacylase